MLATASDDGSVDVWDVPTGSLRETFKGHAGAVRAVAFSPDGTTLYSASTDGSILVWDVRGAAPLGRPFRFAPVPAAGMGARGAGGWGRCSRGESRQLAVRHLPGAEPSDALAGARSCRARRAAGGPCGQLDSLAWSHDGRFVAATGNRDTVVWDVATRRVVRRYAVDPIGNAGVNFSPDDRLLGTAGVDGGLRLYDLPTKKQIAHVQVKGSLQDLDFSSDGKFVAAAGLAGDVAIWDLVRHRLARTIHHVVGLLSIRFSPDGRTIVTGDFRGNVDFWDAATGRKADGRSADRTGTSSASPTRRTASR